MAEFFSVNNIFFTVLAYPMSYIEFIGTILYLWSVWLITQRNMLTWFIGILSVLLYMSLFYQIRLYSDTIEQGYYLIISLYGWWFWATSRQETDEQVSVEYSPQRTVLLSIAVTVVLSILMTIFISRVHILLPKLFPEKASYPFLDATTTVMSFVAMWLMARKRVESWYYWIIVDVIAIWLYYVKEVRFISLLYVILLAMAIKGLYSWHQQTTGQTINLPESSV